MNHNKIISTLVESIRASPMTGRYNVAAATLDRRGNIIAIAQNSYVKTHPMQKRLACLCGNSSRQYLHAEIAALVRSRRKPHYIIIARINRSGQTRLALPCPICMKAIITAGIKNVLYTNSENGYNVAVIRKEQ